MTLGQDMSLVVNPSLQIRSGSSQEEGWALHFFAKKNGHVALSVPVALAQALLWVEQGHPIAQVFDEDVVDVLCASEVLVAPSPRPVYVCPLTSKSIALPASSEPWVLNPAFELRYAAPLGVSILEYGPWGGAVCEYQPDPEVLDAYFQWQAGPVQGSTSGASWALFEAGVLAAPSQISERRRNLEGALTGWKHAYQAERFTFIDDLLAPSELQALQDYCAQHRRRGFLDGDYGVDEKERSHIFDDPELARLHKRAAVLASAIDGRPLIPSYSFLSFYHGGGGLPEHQDKRHCTVSMSLAVQSSDRVGREWPLWVGEAGRGRRSLFWNEGTTLLFEGRTLSHSRPPLPDGEEAVYLILHFQIDPESTS